MTIATHIDVINRNIMFHPGFGLSPKELSKALAEAAQRANDEAARGNAEALGYTPDMTVTVDGVTGAPLASVRPDGEIVAQFALIGYVVSWVYDQVVKFSPKASGDYAKSHRIFADGVEVDTPEDALRAREVTIAPTVPYARKIEGTRGKPESSQAPNGVYQAVAALAKAKFGSVAIKFLYQEIEAPGSSLSAWATGHSAQRRTERSRASQRARDVRQPTIVISLG